MLLTLLSSLVRAEPGALEADAPVPELPPREIVDLGAIPPDIAQIARSVGHLPLPDRMARISEAMLGKPYVSDPLGEGQGIDPDPIARYDAFDCLTFTEEVLALSLAGDPVQAAQIRRDLRYGPENTIAYVNRRHFMELQWIPGVVRDGWLRNTTAEYGDVILLEKEITDQTWNTWRPRKRFAHKDDELPKGMMRLEVLPLATAREVAGKIRPGSVILTVRSDRPTVPIWVTHVSLVVPGPNGKAVLRHATKIGKGGTRDHGVDWYLGHLESYTNWKVVGISILEPVEPLVRSVPNPATDASASTEGADRTP
ncbi:MAG: N-acetylmuramoyl-L-alanine amidase-like domain-containing protein [Myxococcota bacterium]